MKPLQPSSSQELPVRTKRLPWQANCDNVTVMSFCQRWRSPLEPIAVGRLREEVRWCYKASKCQRLPYVSCFQRIVGVGLSRPGLPKARPLNQNLANYVSVLIMFQFWPPRGKEAPTGLNNDHRIHVFISVIKTMIFPQTQTNGFGT